MLLKLLVEATSVDDSLVKAGDVLVDNLFKNVALAVVVFDQGESIGWPIDKDAVRALSSVLERNFLEDRVPFLSPGSLWSKDLLLVLSHLREAFPDKIVNQKCVLVFPLKLLFTETSNSL